MKKIKVIDFTTEKKSIKLATLFDCNNIKFAIVKNKGLFALCHFETGIMMRTILFKSDLKIAETVEEAISEAKRIIENNFRTISEALKEINQDQIINHN